MQGRFLGLHNVLDELLPLALQEIGSVGHRSWLLLRQRSVLAVRKGRISANLNFNVVRAQSVAHLVFFLNNGHIKLSEGPILQVLRTRGLFRRSAPRSLCLLLS